MGDLLGDQRGQDLSPDLHQLVRGEVVLQQPFVGAAFDTSAVLAAPCRHLVPLHAATMPRISHLRHSWSSDTAVPKINGAANAPKMEVYAENLEVEKRSVRFDFRCKSESLVSLSAGQKIV